MLKKNNYSLDGIIKEKSWSYTGLHHFLGEEYKILVAGGR